MDAVELELIRERWRRRRATEALIEPSGEGFGRAQLGTRLPELGARLLILPADPTRYLIDFDAEVRDWWKTEYTDPVRQVPTRWGHTEDSTSHALLSGDAHDNTWQRYLALGHDGSIEAGLGEVAVDHDRFRGYLLTTLVHQVWLAVARFGDVVDRVGPEGPFELTLGLTNTSGLLLGDVGQGWAEPGHMLGRPSRCSEPALLLNRELEEWPDDDVEVQRLAYSLGGQIEDAWGVPERRFVNRAGEDAGAFATHRIRWRL